MTDLETPADFTAMLNEVNAVLFIYADWSNPAMKRLELVKAWESGSFTLHAPAGTRLFSVQPWGFDHAHDWIYDQPQLQFRNADGNLTCLAAPGTLVWLRCGAIVDVEKRFSPDISELDRRTETAFAK
jgi:hypothetical protein